MAHSQLGRLAQLMEDQWGLVTSRQAEAAGVSSETLHRLTREAVLERVAHGVYRLTGAPLPDHLALRAAWLQLAPAVLVWDRTAEQGVISHRSAAALYGLGHLPADRHEFTFAARRQSRRPDVRLHNRKLSEAECTSLRGLLVTRPSRIAADLLDEDEDVEAVAYVVADAIRGAFDYPGQFADSLAPRASRLGFRRGDGFAVLRWLLQRTGDPDAGKWLQDARSHLSRQPGAQFIEPDGSRGPARSLP